MLDFVSARLALGYLLLCAVSCVGVLQIQAARQPLAGLSLWGGRGLCWWGYPVGLALVLGSFLTFYAYTPGIFLPGLAGTELVVLFAGGFILALVLTVAAASLTAPRPGRAAMRASKGEAVITRQLQGWVHVPQSPGPVPALCLVPEIGSSAEELRVVAAHFRALGFVTLSIDWTTVGDPPRYPDVLALVPAGVHYLLRRPQVDERRIGVIGLGLGGDLALRAAATDDQVAAAVAITPCLTPGSCDPGLDLLRQQSLWQAVQWIRRRTGHTALVEQLNALAFLALVPPRPVLLVNPIGSPLFELPSEVETRTLYGSRMGLRWQRGVSQMIGRWCEENL